jgi:tRNA uridine 5-carboxymethylaminomethyl modification enzyme
LTRTTEATKLLISNNFHRSPIFSGQIKSTGPRYCPSIEDKFHRFADKPTHHIFLEPEGNGTSEVYPNGFSTALPEDIQCAAIRTVIGLEEVVITRPGYAVEYDYCPACQIDRSLQTRRVKGLFFAGQINGTSGYEEAAAQGIMAGINAVLALESQPPFVLDRSQAYIGVMIDDLTTRSTTEPYRMFTSRAEYRLALREDNARDRLTDFAQQYVLISKSDYDAFETLRLMTDKEIRILETTSVRTAELGDMAERFASRDTMTIADLARQPRVTLVELLPILARFDGRFSQDREILARAAIRIKYQGYVEKQQREIDRVRRQEDDLIPVDFPFRTMVGLRSEAREKLARFQPASLGQAGRIEGITMGDLAVLSVNLKRLKSNVG